MNGFSRFRAIGGMSLMLVPVLQARNLDEVRPMMLVRLFNLANVSKFTLPKAEEYATAVFKNSGVDVLWRDMGSSTEPDTPLPAMVEFTIVVRAHATQPLNGYQDAMGSQPSNVVADVFYDRVRSFASNTALTASFPPFAEPAVLGHVIAHELGHLLLLSHSSAGIMRARWNPNHFWRPGTVDLFFTKEESRRLRAELIRRSPK